MDDDARLDLVWWANGGATFFPFRRDLVDPWIAIEFNGTKLLVELISTSRFVFEI